MGRRVTVDTKEEAEADAELVRRLTGEIIKRAEANGWTRDELARRAKKKSASTLYNWRSGERKSPSLLDLQAFAKAVGLNVGVIDDSASTSSDGVKLNAGVEGRLKAETQEVVRLMESWPEDARKAFRDTAFAKNGELLADPPEPGEHRSPLSRRK